MTIKITKEARAQSIASIERFFAETMEQPPGNLGAGELLNFFLEEVGPLIYNKAVIDLQERLQSVLMDLDIEVHEEEFPFWRRSERPRK